MITDIFRYFFASRYIRVAVVYRDKDGKDASIRFRIEKGYLYRLGSWSIVHEVKAKMMLEEGIFDMEILSIIVL
jgi:hypothetical protein